MTEPDAMKFPHLWLSWAEQKLADKQHRLEHLREIYRHGMHHPDEKQLLIITGLDTVKEIMALERRIEKMRRRLRLG